MIKISKTLFDDYFKLLKNRWFQILFILGVTLAFTAEFFVKYLQLPYVTGWDGTSHFAVSQYYADHIFPNLFGWVNTWNAGMPWPVGYPPLFNIIIAVLFKTIPIDHVLLFKLVFIILTISLPLIIYFCSLKITRNTIQAFIAGLGTVFFLVNFNNTYIVSGGITMRSTFQVGLYPQLMAAALFIPWLIIFLKSSYRRLALYLSPVFLAAILLINVHAAQVACIIVASYALLVLIDGKIKWQRKIKLLAFLLLQFVICLALIAFWLFPLLRVSSYLLTLSDYNVVLADLLRFDWPLLLTALGGGLLAIKRKDFNLTVIFVSTVLVIAFATFPIYQIFPGLPLQSNRIIPFALLMSIILAAYLIANLKLNIQGRYFINFVLLIILFSWFTQTSRLAFQVVGGLRDVSGAELNMVNYIHDNFSDGRTLIESWYKDNLFPDPGFTNRPMQSILSGLIGTNSDSETFWGVFRESSINMPFIMPIRNSFSSKWQEVYAVACYLCTSKLNNDNSLAIAFDNQPIEKHIEQAKLYGVKYLFVQSDDIKLKLNSVKKGVKFIGLIDNWGIYELDTSIDKAVSLKNEPLLVFTDLKNRDRDFNGYDWLRINEEWLLYGNYDTVFANANDNYLDTSADLSEFKQAFIINYKFRDEEKAFQRLSDFAKRGRLYLLEDNSRLFSRLVGLKNSNIKVIANTHNPHTDIPNLLSMVNKNPIQLPANDLCDIKVSQNHIEFRTSATGPQNIYVKYAYFPWWEGEGVHTYMASPALTLVKTNNQFTGLNFKEPVEDQNFNLISISVIAILIYCLFRLNKGIQKQLLRFESPHLLFTILITTLIVGPLLIAYLSTKFVGGWEGEAHYTISKIYSDQIFPNLYGWIRQWNLGMPWPIGYTPLMSYLLAGLYHLFPNLDSALIYKYFFAILIFAFPMAIFATAYRLSRQKLGAMFAGLLTVILLIKYTPKDVADLSLQGVIGIGSYPFFLAAYFLILLLNVLISSTSFRRKSILASFITALTILTNIHVGEAAIILLVIFFLQQFKFSKRTVLHLLFIFSSLALLLGFWIVPLLSNNYFLTFTLDPVSPRLLFDSIPVIWWVIAAVGVTVAAVKYPKLRFLVVTMGILLLIGLLPLNKIAPGLPVQPNRIISLVYLIGTLLSAFVVDAAKMIGKLPILKYQVTLGVLVILVITTMTIAKPMYPLTAKSFDVNSDETAALEYVSKFTDGRSIVENSYALDMSKNYINILAFQLGLVSNHETAWTVFRESSINMPFIQPVKNSFSKLPESYGVICWLCYDPYNTDPSLVTQLNEQKPDIQIQRGRLLGIKYYLVFSDTGKTKMDKAETTGVTLLKKFGKWSVYADTNFAGQVNLLANEPVLTFAELKTKERSVADYDWLRLNEEWFYLGKYEHKLALANHQSLDTTPDLDLFNITFIADYNYQNIEHTYKKLLDYSRHNYLFLLESNNSLFVRLAKSVDKDHHIYLLPRTGGVRVDMENLMNYVDSIAPVSKNPDMNLDSSTIIWPNAVKVSLQNDSDKYQSVLINQSYFPWWTDFNEGKVFMASPALTLVRTKRTQIDLNFSRQQVNQFDLNTSQIVSYIGLLTLCIMVVLFITRANSIKSYLLSRKYNVRSKDNKYKKELSLQFKSIATNIRSFLNSIIKS